MCHKNSALSNYRIGWHIQKQKDAKSLLVTCKKVSLFLVQTIEEQFLQIFWDCLFEFALPWMILYMYKNFNSFFAHKFNPWRYTVAVVWWPNRTIEFFDDISHFPFSYFFKFPFWFVSFLLLFYFFTLIFFFNSFFKFILILFYFLFNFSFTLFQRRSRKLFPFKPRQPMMIIINITIIIIIIMMMTPQCIGCTNTSLNCMWKKRLRVK